MKATIARTGEQELTVVLRCTLIEAAEVARRLDCVPDTVPRDPWAAYLVAGLKAREELKRIAEA